MPHVIVRMLAVDPKLSNGNRIHTMFGSDPEHILHEFVRGLNYAFGDDRFQFQVDPAGIFYTPNVPYRPVKNIYTPYTEDVGQPFEYLDGDAFWWRRQNHATASWPYENHANIGGLSLIEDPSWAGFDIVVDRNAGKFDILLFYAPGAGQDEGRYNGLAESYGVWSTALAEVRTRVDVRAGIQAAPRAYPLGTQHERHLTAALAAGIDRESLNGGFYRMGGLDPSKPFPIFYANMSRGVGEVTHSASHAWGDAGVMLEAFRWDGYAPQRDHNIRSILTPIDLFLTYDYPGYERGIRGEAHCGTTHFLPNSQSDYDYADPLVVPSCAKMWASYPDGPGWVNGKLDLTNQARFGTFGPDDLATAELLTFEEGQRSELWQWRHWPRATGKFVDGRSCDWRYYLDLAYQVGFGEPVSPPIILGPTPSPIPQPVPVPVPNPAPGASMPSLVNIVPFSGGTPTPVLVPSNAPHPLLLVKAAEWVADPESKIAGVTFGGQPLTKVGDSINKGCASMWYLADPPIGQKIVQVSFVGGAQSADTGCAAEVWKDVDPAHPLGAVATNNATDGEPQVTVPGGASVVTDVLATVVTDHAVAPSQNQTIIANQQFGNAWIATSWKVGDPTGQTAAVLGWNIVIGNDGELQRGYMAVAINGVAPAPDPTPTPAPTPGSGTFQTDPLILAVMAQLEDTPVVDPDMHIAAGTKGLYVSFPATRTVRAIPWWGSEVVPGG